MCVLQGVDKVCGLWAHKHVWSHVVIGLLTWGPHVIKKCIPICILCSRFYSHLQMNSSEWVSCAERKKKHLVFSLIIFIAASMMLNPGRGRKTVWNNQRAFWFSGEGKCQIMFGWTLIDGIFTDCGLLHSHTCIRMEKKIASFEPAAKSTMSAGETVGPSVNQTFRGGWDWCWVVIVVSLLADSCSHHFYLSAHLHSRVSHLAVIGCNTLWHHSDTHAHAHSFFVTHSYIHILYM